jgi:hypothetical protein
MLKENMLELIAPRKEEFNRDGTSNISTNYPTVQRPREKEREDLTSTDHSSLDLDCGCRELYTNIQTIISTRTPTSQMKRECNGSMIQLIKL